MAAFQSSTVSELYTKVFAYMIAFLGMLQIKDLLFQFTLLQLLINWTTNIQDL